MASSSRLEIAVDPWIEGLWAALRREFTLEPEGDSPADISGKNKTEEKETSKNELLTNGDMVEGDKDTTDKLEKINDLRDTEANSDKLVKSQGNTDFAANEKIETNCDEKPEKKDIQTGKVETVNPKGMHFDPFFGILQDKPYIIKSFY